MTSPRETHRENHNGMPVTLLKGLFKQAYTRYQLAQRSGKFVMILLLILALGLLRTLGARLINYWELSRRADADAVLHVQVVQSKDASESRLTLPGTIESYNEALIYSRANGFVKQWFKDIGNEVKQGDVLAILETPEIDQEVQEAQATYDLARAAFVRWTKLRQEDAVSQQELDEKTSAYQYAKANLERTKELLKFGKILAPFDGVVSRRNVKVGDLVNSGNGGSAQALFGVAQSNQLHVYVYLPQTRAAGLQIGQETEVFEPQTPSKVYKGEVSKASGSIDPASRTLQVDVAVPSGDNILRPGSYVEVKIPVSNQGRLIFPTKAILFSAKGTEMAVVKDGVVSRQKVDLGVDYGQTVEVLSGVTPEDQVILNPPDSLVDGQKVVVTAPAAAPANK